MIMDAQAPESMNVHHYPVSVPVAPLSQQASQRQPATAEQENNVQAQQAQKATRKDTK
ncbi:MAG: hypothetical protein ACLPKI_25090 [Streptosporangiaceae bacterium]